MGKSGGSTQSNEPWKEQIPYLLRGLAGSGDFLDTARSYFPQSTIGPQSDQTLGSRQAGMGLIDPTSERGYMDQMMRGDFLSLDSNPHLRDLGEQGAADITRHYQTAIAPQMYGGVGRSGGGAEMNQQFQGARGLGDSLSRFYSGLYGGHYESERGRMGQGLSMAPQLQGSERQGIMASNLLGQQADQYSQRQLDDLVQRFNYDRDEPGQRLQQYMGLVGGNWGGQSSGTSPGWRGSDTAGALLGLGSLAMSCSKAVKDELALMDGEKTLQGIRGLDLAVWQYSNKARTAAQAQGLPEMSPHQHAGPYAEDWHETFGFGNDKTIFFIDGIGVALSAIKELDAKVAKLEAQLAETHKPHLVEVI